MRLLKEEQERLDEQTPGTEGIAPVITSDDLLNAGDVLLNLDGAQMNEEKKRRAAVTLHAIRETDMFELISSQVENKSLIEELIDQYIGNDGNVLPVKKKEKRRTAGTCLETVSLNLEAVGAIRKEEVLEEPALYRYHGCLFPVPLSCLAL